MIFLPHLIHVFTIGLKAFYAPKYVVDKGFNALFLKALPRTGKTSIIFLPVRNKSLVKLLIVGDLSKSVRSFVKLAINATLTL